MMNIKKLFEPADMTVGKPWKSIAMFSIPMLIGNIAQQLYSTVDSIVVGHYVGDNALAAVGSAAPLLNMLLVLFVGISAGVGIMVAQYFGAKLRDELSNTIGTCITLSAIVSVFLMLAAPPIIKPLLRMLNTPASILNDCTDYLVIMMYGIAGMAYYNILSGILRGMGDSFSALIYLLIATVINIVLDVYFVAELNMGVAGVSLATVIAQGISAALCLWKLLHMRSVFDLGIKQLKMTKKHAKQLVKLGLPSGLTQAIMSSAMIIVQSLTNSFGELFIAANVIVMRIDGFAMMPNFSFGTAMTTYTGQNVGANKYDRVTKGAKQGTLMAVVCSTLITMVILIFGKYLMMIFTDTPELIDTSVYVMRILAVGYIAVAVTQSLSGVMRGAGDTVTPMWISLFTTVLLRVPVAYGISFLTRTADLPYGRFECIPVSLLISWLAGALLTTIFYKRGKWRGKAIS
ncbi:MAG: MATE family efflux transporter [Tyzzerella sp.]|nr:MATE family efflux transporter [Tyzzerella sp.]